MTRLGRVLVAVSLCALSLAPACAESRDVVHEDVGQACVSGLEDQPHTILVDFEVCQSSSCDEQIATGCTATLEGNTITIEASATIRGPKRLQACTADCGFTFAECETPALPAGTYTVVYGDGTTELVVPEPMDHEGTCVQAS